MTQKNTTRPMYTSGKILILNNDNTIIQTNSKLIHRVIEL